MEIKKRLIVWSILIAFVVGLSSSRLEAYGNHAGGNDGFEIGGFESCYGEHQGLSAAAIAVKGSIHGENSDIWKEIGKKNVHWRAILRGARDEDEGLNCLQHFYTPSNCPDDTGEYAGMSAGLFGTLVPANYRAKVLYKQAITYYQRGDKEKAYEMLGHVIHLTQDMTVPAHTKKEKTVCITPYHF